MSADLTGYFIAPDGDNTLGLWRTDPNHPSHPIPIISEWRFRSDPAIWQTIADAIENLDRCTTCNAHLPDEGHQDDCAEADVDGAPAEQWQVTTPDAVYAGDDEPGDLLRGAKR